MYTFKNAQYCKNPKTNNNICIKVNIDGNSKDSFIPLDPDNRHYQAIQEWVAEGNTIAEAD